MPPVARLVLASLVLASLGGCTTSLNAGDHGAIAFIFFSIMLIVTAVILWYLIGREE